MKEKVIAKVLSQVELAPSIYDMWLACSIAKDAKPGQFIGVYPKNQATLLPRPISICEVNEDKTALRIGDLREEARRETMKEEKTADAAKTGASTKTIMKKTRAEKKKTTVRDKSQEKSKKNTTVQ